MHLPTVEGAMLPVICRNPGVPGRQARGAGPGGWVYSRRFLPGQALGDWAACWLLLAMRGAGSDSEGCHPACP